MPARTRSPQNNGERGLQLLLDAIPDYGICMLDHAGRFLTWNAGAAATFGYQPDEAIGSTFALLWDEEDRVADWPARALQDARAGRHESERRLARKDASRFWAHIAIEPFNDAASGFAGFALTVRDVSARRAAQEALGHSERRFRMFVDGVIDYAICMLDPGGVVTDWNAGAERIEGYRAADIIGQHFSRFYTPEDRAAGLPLRALEVAAHDGRHESEGWRLRKDGSRFRAAVVLNAIRDADVTLLGYAKITRDITERAAREAALRRSEQQFRLLVAEVQDYALFMLDPNGVVASWNTGAERIKGYRAEEIVGQHFSRFYTERDRATGLPGRALHEAVETGRYEAEAWRVRKDGRLFWANVVIDPIRDETGALIGFTKITRDITERREAQAALRKTQEQLAQAQKIEALGKLTGGVAHDFNNLLMIVSGHASLLERLVADNPKGARAIEAIETATQRGARLTRQLLTFARRQRLTPEAIDLAERMTGLRSMVSGSLSASVQLVTDVADAWPIEADVAEFELALINIVLNARDALPQGGRVVIMAENVVLRPDDLDQQLDGEFVAITVTDNGVGVPPDILPQVFDPFFTTKPVGRGTGLGLSQVYGFAAQSGGAATITSKVRHGTSVTMYLPRATAARTGAQARQSQAERAAGGRVLVVEDNPDVSTVTAAMLEDLGYETVVVSSAEAALEMLGRDQAFDLMFSDVVMAGMDGAALARQVRTRLADLPILLTTGYGAAADAASAEFRLLRKPYQLSELSKAVGEAMNRPAEPEGPANLLPFRRP